MVYRKAVVVYNPHSQYAASAQAVGQSVGSWCAVIVQSLCSQCAASVQSSKVKSHGCQVDLTGEPGPPPPPISLEDNYAKIIRVRLHIRATHNKLPTDCTVIAQ